MPEVGFEPTRPCGHGILSAASLPFLHSGLSETIEGREGDNPAAVDAAGRIELIRELCSFKGRWPGTDAERRASAFLVGRLKGMGRRVEVEPTYVHPEYALAHALHCAIAIAGSLAAIALPPLGFGLVLIAATSLYLDQNARAYLLRRLFFRRASQNLVSPGPSPDAPARLYLVAHYDAAKTGYVFRPEMKRRARRLSERARLLLGPYRLIFWGGMAPLLPVLGARMAGVDATWLSVLQLIPTVLLVVALILLIDIWLSEIVPGAYDNASGVAAVLSVAEALDREPAEHLDVWVLLTGAEECNAQGMQRFIRAHRRELDRANTLFVNLDSVSDGTIAYQASEGAIVSQAMDRRLVELCEAVADADREGPNRYGARPVRNPFHTDALPPTTFGFRAISLSTVVDGVMPDYYHTAQDTPERVDAEALTHSVDFTLELVRALDRDVGRAGGAR